MTRRRRSPRKRWHWPSDEDIGAFALVVVIVFAVVNAVASCAFGPNPAGEPDIYEPADLSLVAPTTQLASPHYRTTSTSMLSRPACLVIWNSTAALLG